MVRVPIYGIHLGMIKYELYAILSRYKKNIVRKPQVKSLRIIRQLYLMILRCVNIRSLSIRAYHPILANKVCYGHNHSE